MKSINIGDTIITFYSSIKELPIELSKKFHAFLMQDTGIGNTFESVDEHLERLTAFLTADKKDEAIEETKNLRYNLFNMLSEWDYPALSFVCLIHSVNGEEIKDRSTEGLNDLVTRLSEAGLTNADVAEIREDVKKNWKPSENFTFQSSLVTT